MAEKKNIFETINAVMEEIGAVGKNSRNEKQKYMYRGVDDVMNALNPAFTKHKLFMVPEVVSQKREERQTANRKKSYLFRSLRQIYLLRGRRIIHLHDSAGRRNGQR